MLDTDAGHFVECNDNAVRFFKMSREELLAAGPERISPPEQPDGTPSFGIARGYIDRALAGEAPCFEWLHRDAHGHDIPCEVRMVRLPSSGRRLIRGSITDITERKRSELLAIGERRVFERMTSNADLAATLEAISETAERVTPDALCTVSTYDESAGQLRHIAGQRLSREFLKAIGEVGIAARTGSCARMAWSAARRFHAALMSFSASRCWLVRPLRAQSREIFPRNVSSRMRAIRRLPKP